jgi:hypothetical protein
MAGQRAIKYHLQDLGGRRVPGALKMGTVLRLPVCRLAVLAYVTVKITHLFGQFWSLRMKTGQAF